MSKQEKRFKAGCGLVLVGAVIFVWSALDSEQVIRLPEYGRVGLFVAIMLLIIAGFWLTIFDPPAPERTRQFENLQRWFDAYEGPKSLGWEDGQFVCWIGFNEVVDGCGRGISVTGSAPSLSVAIAAAKVRYENARDQEGEPHV